MQKTMIIILLIIFIILLGAAYIISEHENEVLRRNKRLCGEVEFRERKIRTLCELIGQHKSQEAAAKDEICT